MTSQLKWAELHDPRLHHQPELPARERAQVGCEVVGVREPDDVLGHRVPGRVDRGGDDRREELLLVGEVLVDGLLGHGGARRDLVTVRSSSVVRESPMPSTLDAKPLLTGLVIGESPRWHDGRLWFANWGTTEIVAVDLDGNAEVVAAGPGGLGWSIDWLPDGRLLVTGPGLLRVEPDGSMVPHADLSGLGIDGFNEIVVDGRGNVYVNGGVDFHPGEGEAPGMIALVTPDGSVRRVADGLEFPNGMVVTPDNSTLIVSESFAQRLTAFDIDDDGTLSNRRAWAEGIGPDGICMDAEGAIWTDAGGFGDNVVGRIREGGEVLERVQLDRPCFACMLGGDDGRTLFMLTADWRMTEGFEDNIARLTQGPRTGQVLSAQAPAPHAGWP
jgi:sugar lactone lactonase YvrE